MSVVPDEWSDPGSRAGLCYDLGWVAFALLVFAAIAYVEPFGIAVEVTPLRLVGSVALGLVLGGGVGYVATRSERARAVWSADRNRFAGLFLVAAGCQVGLLLAPTWTVLTLLVAFLTVVPFRVAAYLAAR